MDAERVHDARPVHGHGVGAQSELHGDLLVREAARDAVVDRGVEADVKVEKGQLFEAAPVAARIRMDINVFRPFFIKFLFYICLIIAT